MNALLAYYLLLIIAVFAWPSWRLWRREGVNALVLPNSDTAEGVIGAWFKAVMASVALFVAACAWGMPMSWLGEMPWLAAAPLDVPGWTLLAGSLAWMTVAQAQMGDAWRIGIDEGHTPHLARRGLFALSRNPIFLGLRLNLAGLFLLLPNAVTLVLLIVAEALIQVQVRLEERHLADEFGDSYSAFRASVPRWL